MIDGLDRVAGSRKSGEILAAAPDAQPSDDADECLTIALAVQKSDVSCGGCQ
jgi:hypothetical protein